MDDASSSSSSAAAPPAHPSVLDTIQTKLSPGVLLVVAILAMVFFIFGLLNLLVQNILRLRRARRRRLRVGDDGSPTALQGQLQQLFHLHDAGVDQAFIDALPVFLYRDIVKGDKEDGPFDCAVCLCEFAMDDGLRLLPTCGHAFHVPCIDAWLLAHSTCPLCRGSVLADLAPEPSSPALFVLESESHAEVTAMEAPGVDNEGAPKAEEEEVVEVKLGKLRCVDDGNGVTGDLAVVETTTRSSDDNGNNGRRSLGQRRCLSMGSYEYVMDERAELRVAIKRPKKLQSSSRSRRRRLAFSDFDFGFGNAKKLGAPAWEAAVKDQAADAPAAASRLKKDSFSVSKIWMVPAAASRKEDGRALVAGGSRRSVSFRWPAMAAVEASRNNEGGIGNEERRDVESQPGTGSSGNIAGERTAPLWAAGRWQPNSSSAGSHP